MTPAELSQQRIVIVGAGLSGQSLMRYLNTHAIAWDLAEARAPDATVQALIGDAVSAVRVHRELSADALADYDVLLLSPGVPRAQPAVAAAIARGATVIGDVELFAAIVDSPVVAITGSNGKSTVVSWIAHVLTQAGFDAVACGNIGVPVLDAIAPGVDVYVVELSSYQLESTRSLAPSVSLVLNISEDHLDRYDSLAHYAATKQRIHQRSACIVINLDDPLSAPDEAALAAWRQVHPQGRVVSFSLSDPAAHYHCVAAPASAANDACWLQGGDALRLRADTLPLPGAHNVANALAVLAALDGFALDAGTVRTAMQSFTGLRHRTEWVGEHAGARWYNDSKGTNVDACRKAIEAMPGPVILIAGGQGKGADFRLLRDSVAAHVKRLLLLGEDADRLHAALADLCFTETVEDMAAAVQRAAAVAEPGDCVLLSPACASFDMFDNYMHRGDVFAEMVRGLAA